ncbi:tyrosine-type recombinase/integrase [Clostridium coskatii]|uniref:Tyrosine recombinase XerC n=1 Tax=Clostridium coskatii TaxID=1705578 RepID=A0A166TA73_9CLOT|nr:tyrosine-type recombinase/integrase [Clostridium coskatii]OAA93429.1 Tyrosine recombinase XerC [Clostridium coskatii]OBR96218.1 tyrosine recombinase XerC [Clostridium coskatii]
MYEHSYILNHRDRALFILVLETGLRIVEVVALKWSDIDFENNELKVQRTFKRVSKINIENPAENKTAILAVDRINHLFAL